MQKLNQLIFDNSFYQLGQPFFTEVKPQGLTDPKLVSASEFAAQLIGLAPSELKSNDFLNIFSGNQLLDEFKPLAMIYSGHQFGHYNPQLGDGRALLLGEVKTTQGNINLNLKGAGMTPYSRQGDGRAVLRSSIREYLCSEAMAGLNIPTTRALSLISGSNTVYREQIETAAMVLRLSPTHIRFGNFEYFFYTKQHDELKKLADYCIKKLFPDIAGPTPYADFFKQVVLLTARMIAHWQAVGFAHGVMNTDNMSLIGQTFDYGPFGFLDEYNPTYICNHSDPQGRYSFENQPNIGLWNCNALAHALSPLIDKETLIETLGLYEQEYLSCYADLMRKKLGLNKSYHQDQNLCNEILALLKNNQVDYTIFFRRLCDFSTTADHNKNIEDLFLARDDFKLWAQHYQQRLLKEANDDTARSQKMKQANPKYILRNHLVQIAIDKAQQGDYSQVNCLLNLLENPFDEQPEFQAYANFAPAWSKDLEISCSS